MSRLSLSWLCAVLFLVGGASLPAATLNYFEDFEDDAVGTTPPSEPFPESGTFVESNGAAWSVVSGGISGKSYRNAYTTLDTPSHSIIDFSGALGGSAASATDFTISVSIRFNTSQSNGSTAGIGFLMASSGSGTGYFVDIGMSGNLRIVEIGTVRRELDVGTVNLSGVYVMTLQGTYVDTNADTTKDALSISVSLSGANVASTAVTFLDTTLQTGTYFGLRDRTNGSATLNVDFDNFSVVPEPATASLVIAAFGLFLSRRKTGGK